MKDHLLALIMSNTSTKFSLTCDTWKSNHNIYFICVTLHWIDVNWDLQKRIIAFQEFSERHTAQNIAQTLFHVCNSFFIKDRIFSISFDNASNNTSSIPLLIAEMKPVLDGLLFHNRCACHIINLCVQDGLKFLDYIIAPIRDFVYTIRSPGHFKNEWIKMCKNYNKKPRKFTPDTPTRWNSTYLMLVNMRGYEVVIQDYYNTYLYHNNDIILSTSLFEIVNSALEILGAFEISTTTLSGTYYPTSHLLVPTIIQIAYHLQVNKNNSHLHDMIDAMQLKFFKYYEEIPLINCIACALDPTVKFEGLETFLNFYNDWSPEYIVIDAQTMVQKTIEILNNLFTIYEDINNASHGHDTSVDVGASSSASSSSSSIMKKIKGKSVSILDPYSLFGPKRHKSSSTTEFNEVTIFGKTQLVEKENDSFNVLQWWKQNEKQYPILSTIARDILTVPVSTVASESAFSAGGRVLDEKRRAMHPTTLETVVLLKDWFDAEKRQQGKMEECIFTESLLSSPEADD